MTLDNADEDQLGFISAQPPMLVSLTPFTTPSSSSSRRLVSSRLAKESQPMVCRSRRQILAWVNLDGRLVGADEATKAKTVDPNGSLSAEETLAWEMFTPMQRVLIVAVVASAYIRSEKDRKIVNLQKSVELRDQVLLSMQQKLDNLCEQVNYFKDPPDVFNLIEASINKSIDSSCKLCRTHSVPHNNSLVDTSIKELNGDEMFDNKTSLSDAFGPEERRMSDLSDWAPSIISSVDVQLDTPAIEHINSLRKECEDKDVTIKELSAFIQSSEVSGSKRISELEDIIRRKNMIINKLRKDIIVLEQKVVTFSRLQRTSYSPKPCPQVQAFPAMADNLLYDMEVTTSPSSSDSDSSPKIRTQCTTSKRREISVPKLSNKALKEDLECGEVKITASKEKNSSLQKLKPLKEKSLNQMPNSMPSSKPKHKRWV